MSTPFLIQIIGTFGTILGVLIGAYFAYLLARRNEAERELRSLVSQRRGLALTLMAEIEIAHARDTARSAKFLEALRRGEAPPAFALEVAEDYFTVYNSNAGKLGLFEPADARAIVQLYMHAKAYLDGIRSLARFAEKHPAMSPSPMPMYAEALMADHRTITQNLPLVLDILKKYAT